MPTEPQVSSIEDPRIAVPIVANPPHNTGRTGPRHPTRNLLDGPLQHHAQKVCNHAAGGPCLVTSLQFPSSGQLKRCPSHWHGSDVRVIPATTRLTPALMQHPSASPPARSGAVQALMRVVLTDQATVVFPHAQRSGRNSWNGRIGQSAWRWPRFPVFFACFRACGALTRLLDGIR